MAPRPNGRPVRPATYRPRYRPADDLANVHRAAGEFGAPRAGSSRSLPRSPVRRFVVRYGWRAYALPLLSVATVAAVINSGAAPKSAPAAAPAHRLTPAPAVTSTARSAPPVAAGKYRLKSDAPGRSADSTLLKEGELPAGPAYTEQGKGTFRVLPGTTQPVGSGPLYRYSIEVENGVRGIDLTQYAALVVKTLSDPRSWSGHGVRLQRVDSGPVDFHVSLTSAMTVRRLCGYTIHVETSCYAAAGTASGLDVNRVVLNDARWVRGAEAYLGDLPQYRVYMINHEDGHALGHQHAHQCLANGLAPVMMQQTFGLMDAATGKLCQANPWPYPPGVSDAPGAEGPDTDQNSEFTMLGGRD